MRFFSPYQKRTGKEKEEEEEEESEKKSRMFHIREFLPFFSPFETFPFLSFSPFCQKDVPSFLLPTTCFPLFHQIFDRKSGFVEKKVTTVCSFFYCKNKWLSVFCLRGSRTFFLQTICKWVWEE